MKKPKLGTKAKKKKPRKEFHRPDYRIDITEAELINPLPEDLQEGWRAVRKFAASLGTQKIYASGWAIMFSKKNCYMFVRPKKKYLETCIFLPEQVDSELLKVRQVAKQKFAHTFRLIHEDQVGEPLTEWISQAFSAMESKE